MNTIEIVGATELPSHKRAKLEIEVMEKFIDNGKTKPFTFREYGTDAFTDNDDGTIISDNDSLAVAKAMVTIAESKGADYIKPSGSDIFMENVQFAVEQVQARQDSEGNEHTHKLDITTQGGAAVDAPEANAQQQAVGGVTVAKAATDEDVQHQHQRAGQANQDVQAEQGDNKEKPGNTVTGTSLRKTDDDAENERRNALARKVVDAYVIDGNRYLLRGDKQQEAFRDNGAIIKAKLDDERTVSDAINLMASRGVGSIKVSGTKAFSRNAWIAAQSHGMSVAGYKPTAQDLALFQKPENVITEINAKQAVDDSAKQAQPKPGELSGKLIDHGAAPYQHDQNKNTSYYVSISDVNGNEKTQWGIDLKAAIADAGVQAGDNVTLRKTATEGVTVEDERGSQVNAKRATWVVDSPERAAIVRQAREQDKATIIKAAGAVVASRVSESSDQDAINLMISDRIDSHVGPLPEVAVYREERQEALARKDEQQQQMTL